MSFRCHVPTRFLIHQCQIITFLILKSDNIENSRIELKGIVLQVRSNQIKVTFTKLFYPSTWYICHFFLFHIEIEGKCGWIIGGGGGGGGGAKGMLAPPAQIIGGGLAPPGPPLPTPMILIRKKKVFVCVWGGGGEGAVCVGEVLETKLFFRRGDQGQQLKEV